MLLKCFTQHASKFGKLSSGCRTEKGQFSFQSPKKDNAKECSNYCTIVLISQSNAQNSPSQAWTVHKPRTSRCSSWIYKRQRNQRSNCQHTLDHQKSKRVPEKHLPLYWLCQSLCVDHKKLWKILKEMGIPDHLTTS